MGKRISWKCNAVCAYVAFIKNLLLQFVQARIALTNNEISKLASELAALKVYSILVMLLYIV